VPKLCREHGIGVGLLQMAYGSAQKIGWIPIEYPGPYLTMPSLTRAAKSVSSEMAAENQASPAAGLLRTWKAAT